MSWNTVELGNVLTLKRGYDLTEDERQSGKVPVVSSSGITGHHNESKAEGPGVITGRYGSLGSVYYVEKDYWPHNTTLYVEDFKGTHRRFAYYLLESLNLKRYSGTTSVPGLNRNDLHKMEVTVPPLPVQRRIADILGALDDKIELNRRMNETLEEMAQTLYYHLFEGAVKTGEIGLEELVEIKPRMPVPDDDEVLTYVGMADVEPHRMSVTDYGEKQYTSGRRFVNGDTLMARITPSLENGKTAFVDSLDEGEMAFGSTEFTVMRAREDTSPYFVYCCARDERFRDYAISTMTGSSGRQRVQENLLGEYTFEDFDQERMESFHEQAAPLFRLIRSNTSENRTLAETRDYLLPKLISGEVEVEEGQEAVDAAT